MVKERITVTIEKELIFELDSMAASPDYRSRSHATEFLINLGLKQKKS